MDIMLNVRLNAYSKASMSGDSNSVLREIYESPINTKIDLHIVDSYTQRPLYAIRKNFIMNRDISSVVIAEDVNNVYNYNFQTTKREGILTVNDNVLVSDYLLVNDTSSKVISIIHPNGNFELSIVENQLLLTATTPLQDELTIDLCTIYS